MRPQPQLCNLSFTICQPAPHILVDKTIHQALSVPHAFQCCTFAQPIPLISNPHSGWIPHPQSHSSLRAWARCHLLQIISITQMKSLCLLLPFLLPLPTTLSISVSFQQTPRALTQPSMTVMSMPPDDSRLQGQNEVVPLLGCFQHCAFFTKYQLLG